MNIETYSDLINAAKSQPDPQRLLFVLTKAELPEGYSAEQKAQFEQGEGGVLVPVLCVDKVPEDVADFAQLVEESEHTGMDWDIAFVSAMSGRGGIALNSDEVIQPLKMMTEQIQAGMISQFLAINRQGEIIQLS
ncbi:ribonucleotide reductase subunit alpha [Nitrincola alkalilacustris]|uniref:ribonucleotide reductase subunit alpha n=1 Tax=Nitrincola alkalilacustris TaxID=1571224 RepID=UPI00124CD482|nr:ribonucleotide reductase subunit alpha [Nitrincola alkalilacustris]